MASPDTKLAANPEVDPAEDVVQALINTLVDPLLPLRASDILPPQDHQISVAKQMHAVVLLYNYYHRKHKPEIGFLDFVSFCKMAVVVKPPLTAFMKLLMQNESAMSHCGIDYDDSLSMTEKAIKDACDIATALDASRDDPDFKDWPISKVAVLLIDAAQENSLLQYGSITQGVWAPIEKELEAPLLSMEASGQLKVGGNKRARSSQTESIGDTYLNQLAYTAMKDATGYDSCDLEILDTRVTYSLTKCKSATLLYLMRYRGSFSIKEEVPLKFLVEGLQGPLAKKFPYGVCWETTLVVEYHHVLPYLKFISCWVSGGFAGEVAIDSDVVEKNNGKKESGICDGPLAEDNNGKFYFRSFLGSSRELRKLNLSFFTKTCLDIERASKEGSQEIRVYHRRKNNLSQHNKTRVQDDSGPPKHSQICLLGDTLALYEDNNARIRDSSEDALARQCVKSIVSGNSDLLLESRKHDSVEGNLHIHPGKSPCQDLEYICWKNDWQLPRYLMVPAHHGKFFSRAVVQGNNFKLSSEGCVELNPDAARESAAAQMIATIERSLAR